MLSIIIKEHKETHENILNMMSQAQKLPMEKELIFSTSMGYNEFIEKYQPWNYNYNTIVLSNVDSCGEAVSLGVRHARGENLIVMDSHVCYPPKDVKRLIDTLEEYPTCLITPGIRHANFPNCDDNKNGYVAHGGKIKISEKNAFEWIWLNDNSAQSAISVPLVCACAFAIKKDVFNKLNGIYFDFEEEKSMRLWHLGHPSLCEPRSVFGHWFRSGLMSATQQKNWFSERVSALFVNIVEEDNWTKLEKIMSKSWGKLWYDGLKYATKYQWLRDDIMKHKDNMNENYFIDIDNH